MTIEPLRPDDDFSTYPVAQVRPRLERRPALYRLIMKYGIIATKAMHRAVRVSAARWGQGWSCEARRTRVQAETDLACIVLL